MILGVFILLLFIPSKGYSSKNDMAGNINKRKKNKAKPTIYFSFEGFLDSICLKPHNIQMCSVTTNLISFIFLSLYGMNSHQFNERSARC